MLSSHTRYFGLRQQATKLKVDISRTAITLTTSASHRLQNTRQNLAFFFSSFLFCAVPGFLFVFFFSFLCLAGFVSRLLLFSIFRVVETNIIIESMRHNKIHCRPLHKTKGLNAP